MHSRRAMRQLAGASTVPGWGQANTQPTFESMAGARLVYASNRSYAKLVGELGDASQLGSTLTAEGREALGMLTSITFRAIKAARAVRKLRFDVVARELGLPIHESVKVVRRTVIAKRLANGKKIYRTFRIRKTYFDYGTGREYLKTVANGWLMYNYGIKPLMGDIYNSIEVLQRPSPYHRISGKATEEWRTHSYTSSRIGSTSTTSNCRCTVKQSVEVSVINPNLWLANRLGLINPAQWIWEAIPFSFVIDWFGNVESVIMSMTDFTGLQTHDPVVNQHGFRSGGGYVINIYDKPSTWSEASGYDRYCRRTTGLVLPRLKFRYERLGWRRAANAISILVGLLKGRVTP